MMNAMAVPKWARGTGEKLGFSSKKDENIEEFFPTITNDVLHSYVIRRGERKESRDYINQHL